MAALALLLLWALHPLHLRVSPLLESPENLFFLSVFGHRLLGYGFGGTRESTTLISTRDGGARPSSDSGVDYVYVMATVFCHQVS